MTPNSDTTTLADVLSTVDSGAAHFRPFDHDGAAAVVAARCVRQDVPAGDHGSATSPTTRCHGKPTTSGSAHAYTSSRPRPGQAGISPESWVDSHGDVLYRFALARLRDSEVAEEVVQETFLAALGNHASFTERSRVRTWLVGILRHKIIDHYRSRRRFSTTSISEAAESDRQIRSRESEGAALSCASEACETAEQKEFWAVFHVCLSKLTAPVATTFVLHEIEELNGLEVCRILGISRSNLWTRLYRARQLLRAHLERHWTGDARDATAERRAC